MSDQPRPSKFVDTDFYHWVFLDPEEGQDADDDGYGRLEELGDLPLSTDAQGHQHKGKGQGGGQFTGGSGGKQDQSTRSDAKASKGGDEEDWQPKHEHTRTFMDAIFDIADMFGVGRKKVKLIHKGLKEADVEYKKGSLESITTQHVADDLAKATELIDKRLSSGQPLAQQDRSDLIMYVYESAGKLNRADPQMYYSSPMNEFLQRLLVWLRKNA